jgi:hypothetical protein
MPIEVQAVIPVCNNSRFTKEILGYIEQQTYVPKVFLIDNGSIDDTPEIVQEFKERMDIEYIRNPVNIGVNNSWNQGLLRTSADVVSILNNDLILPPFFFEAIQQVFTDHTMCGYLVPVTNSNSEATLMAVYDGQVELNDLPFREGWAHSIRRGIPMTAGPIPSDRIYTFYGDDYLYHICVEMGFKRGIMVNVPIHHYLSQTLYSTGTQETFGDDEQAWRAIRGERAKGIRPDGQTAWKEFEMKLDKMTDEEKVIQEPTAQKVVVEELEQKKAKAVLPKVWKHSWKTLPAAVDMACYADYYQTAIKELLTRIPDDQRRTFVELGVREGCSARIMLDVIHSLEHWKMVLVDPVENKYMVEVVDDSRVEFWQTTAEAAVSRFKEGRLVLVHIDVDPHGYEQTRDIFNFYASKVKVGGVVLFHDCTSAFGVHRFVCEIRDTMQGTWQVDFCPAHPESAISAPAKAVKIS